MNRISNTSYFDQTISNIQSSYEKLIKLQNQVQSQKAMERPSDDPVRANQAILLESNLKEIQQYQKNVQSGSDALTYADQTLDSLMVPLNNAISKVQQGLNAEQDSTSRAAIASELEAILDTFISIGNTQLEDKNIFGGSNTTGDVFTRLGGDILFNGNNDAFNMNIAHSETIKSNITANDIFGSSSTILDSEHNLNAKLSELSLEAGLPIEKTLNVNEFKVSGRNVVVDAFVKATGLGITTAKPVALSAAMDALANTSYDSAVAYANAVRVAASTAIKSIASTGSDLNLDESYQIQQVVDAAKSNYLSNTSSLTLQSGDHKDTGLLTVTFTSTTTTNVATSVAAVNKAATQAAGFSATTGEVDNSNVIIDARIAALAAFKAAGKKLGLTTQVDLSTQLTTVNAAVTATTTSETYALAVQNAAVTAFNPTFTTYAGLDANAKIQVDAAVQAAKNTFSAVEFRASTTRSGMSLRHASTDQISIAEGSSDARLINAFGVTGKNNTSTHIFDTVLAGSVTTLAADRLMTITLPSADYLNVQLRAGDTVEVIARRINTAVNQLGIHDDIRKVVASVDNTAKNGGTTGVKHLTLTGSSHFKVSMDTTTEIAGGNAVGYNVLNAEYRSVDDLRGGNGMDVGTYKIMADNLTTGFANNVTVMNGDSYEYLLNQLNDLSGFDAVLNTDQSGIKLTNTAKYAVDMTPTAPFGSNNLVVTSTAKGLAMTITFTKNPSTLSEMAEDINTQSSINHLFHAEVNIAGTGLVFTSNEAFTLSSADAAMTKNSTQITDLSALNLIDSSFLSSLGLNRTPDSSGVTEGRSIVGRQVRLSELNGGQGIRTGSIRITLGNTSADIDMNSASSLRDVKILIENAMPGLVKVGLNTNGNGLAIASVHGGSMRIEELNGGAAGRTLGLIKAPASSVTGTNIEGGDIDPAFHGKTLLKDLNGGLGIDTSGFVITNGDHTTTITMDSDGDGVDDIRTLEELVNHINQKAKQDQVYVTAEVDPKKGGLKITSKLSNTSMSVSEKLASNTSYRTTGIVESTTTPTTGFVIHPTTGATSATTMNISLNSDSTKTLQVAIAAGDSAAQVATKINTAAGLTTTLFSFRAVENKSGGVDILSNEAITVSDTVSSTYTTQAYTPNPPVLGKTASDLGLLGSFSDSTLLSTLNNGSGIENGTFKIKYGPAATSVYTFSNSVVNTSTTPLTFYNENGSQSVSVANPSVLSATDISNLGGLGITVSSTTTTVGTTTTTNHTFTSSNRFSTQQGATAPFTTLPLTVTSNTLATTAKEVTVDVEFAETLGEVKTAIEAATNNEILVSFSASNRIQLTLASGDDTQQIEISEIGGSLATATTLGLIHSSVAYGRDLRDGITEQLSNGTLLSDLDITLDSVTSISGINDLLINTDVGLLTVNVSNARTVGDVISLINSKTATDAGTAIQLQAKVEQGKYLSITNSNSGTINVVSTSFSTVAEKLGLVPDPELVGESHYQGGDLSPQHQAENFFSALTTLRDQFQGSVISNSVVSNTLTRLTQLQNKFLIARGDAGGRISRLDTVNTRYEEESVYIEGLYGDKIGIDVIDTTQRYLAQQQVYESSLSVAGRILGTSLFSYI